MQHPISTERVREGASRRSLLGGCLAAVCAIAAPLDAHSEPAPKQDEAMPELPLIAYVGCRTTRERNARGDGIAVYRVAPDGTWDPIQLLDGLLNPSFLAFGRDRRTLYTVHGDASEVSAFRVDATDGRLHPLNRASCSGRNPVHLSVDPTGRFLLVANHITVGEYVSNIAVLALNGDGALGEVVDCVPLTGRIGPHRAEQPFAKPHQVLFDPSGRFVVVPDKGLDLISTYRLGEDGKLARAKPDPAQAREGAGPRHAWFHPRLPYLYVVDELTSTILACRFDDRTGAITPFQEVSALPDSFVGFSRASEIEMSRDGRFVYASNRGHESIAAFAVEPETGRLTPAGWTPSAGRTPRFFTLGSGDRHLFVANEDSDTVVRFERDAESGALADGTVVTHTGSPTCILF